MISVSDIINLLEKIPIWKQLSSLPKRVEELERRIAELEGEKLESSSFDQCPKCKKMTYELVKAEPDKMFGNMGVETWHYKCKSCGWEGKKQIT